MSINIKKRNFPLDALRVFACYLVIQQHTSEFYYIGENLSVVKDFNTYIIGIISSVCRASVPLFVMLSGFFLLPDENSVSVFFKKRITRVAYPFIAWCVIYALYFALTRGDSSIDVIENILKIPVNFGTDVGHLWFVYMLFGLYLLVPIISPWIKSCSKKEFQFYLFLWAIASSITYIHFLFPQIWGECFWNPTPTLYYFTGFGGYFLLGGYVKKFGSLPIKPAIIVFILGYAITSIIYCLRIETTSLTPDLELSWNFCSINVAMMAYGLFSIFNAIRLSGTSKMGTIITNISENSYAIYLAHIIVLNFFYGIFGTISSNVLLTIPLISICTFSASYIIVLVLSFLPKSKYWLG